MTWSREVNSSFVLRRGRAARFQLGSSVSSRHQGDHAGRAEPWRLAGLSEELTFDVLQLRRQTERELGGIQAQ